MNYNLQCNLNRVQGMLHVEDVGDVIFIFFECNDIFVKDVKDRSNTPKGCNAMYVKDVEDWKGTYTHIFAHNFLNIQLIFKSYVYWSMSKMLKVKQSLTSSTFFVIHKSWYDWKALILSFLKLFSDWKSIKY